MKVCQNCSAEIAGLDGDNLCSACDSFAGDKKKLSAKRQAMRRKERDSIMRDMGMVKVKGALGGVLWE